MKKIISIIILLLLLAIVGCKKEQPIFKEYNPCEEEQIIHFRIYEEGANETLSSFSTNYFKTGMEEAVKHKKFELQFQSDIQIEYKCGGDYYR